MKTTVMRAFLAVAMLGVIGAPDTGIRDVPERLSDAAFWQVVEETSEPGGYFRSDNFVSNEGELQYVISELERVVPKGRAYVGVGPEQNLTYIAALEPSVAFIVDIRRQNLVHHLMFKALMEMSGDRVDYLERLLSRPRPDGVDSTSTVSALFNGFAMVAPDTLLFRTTLASIESHLEAHRGRPLDAQDAATLLYVFGAFAEAGGDLTYSFGQMNGRRFGGRMPTLAEIMTETDEHGVQRGYLASEENYDAVRQLHERNLIIPVVGDFGGEQALRAVGTWLRRHGAIVGVFYASNVEQYLFRQSPSAARFYANLRTLPLDSTSTFVRSVTGRGWVPLRNPRSRMAQLAMPMQPMLRAIERGQVANYAELVMLRP